MSQMNGRNRAALSADPGIVFMGTPDYAVPSLKRLKAAGYRVQAVVTQPDRPRGRGRKPLPPPVKEAAVESGLLVLQPEKASDAGFCREILGLGPDLLVVVAFGQILTKELLEIPRWGALNIHASLLPRTLSAPRWLRGKGYHSLDLRIIGDPDPPRHFHATVSLRCFLTFPRKDISTTDY